MFSINSCLLIKLCDIFPKRIIFCSRIWEVFIQWLNKSSTSLVLKGHWFFVSTIQIENMIFSCGLSIHCKYYMHGYQYIQYIMFHMFHIPLERIWSYPNVKRTYIWDFALFLSTDDLPNCYHGWYLEDNPAFYTNKSKHKAHIFFLFTRSFILFLKHYSLSLGFIFCGNCKSNDLIAWVSG